MKLQNRQKIYFASDNHLGSPSDNVSRLKEKKFIKWLDFIKKDASSIFLLGDLFDFWFEYKMVVPKGFTRVLGKLAEISDSGIKINFFAKIVKKRLPTKVVLVVTRKNVLLLLTKKF